MERLEQRTPEAKTAKRSTKLLLVDGKKVQMKFAASRNAEADQMIRTLLLSQCTGQIFANDQAN